jgi:uncharacterized protein
MPHQSQKTYTFHVDGMHCSACTSLIEERLVGLPYLTSVQASLTMRRVTIIGGFNDAPEKIAEELTKLVRGQGYTISVNKRAHNAEWGDFAYAVPIAATIILAFLLLQRAGLTNLITGSNVTYGTAFVIGLIASVSTCLAIVGGLVLSLSASSAKEGGTWRTQTLFHIGRIGGFFVLGGLVGLLGSSLQLGLTANVILGAVVAVVMLILGINLLGVFHFAKKFQVTLPARLGRNIVNGSMPSTKSDLVLGKHDHYFAPVLVGIGTFFLPCGFTQSMQLYALSTKSFMEGALTMTAFSLGTLPMLALLSFGSLNIAHKPWKGIFFKTAGIIVIALTLFNLANMLATTGVISPLFNF